MPAAHRTATMRRANVFTFTSALASAAAVVAVAAVVLMPERESVAAESQTKVILNGKPVPVHFNDGDSFRVLAGEYKDAKARLSGYNTLESYGPVHQWGSWDAHELYVLAKMGTYNGRDGVWECETDGDLDGYGRILVWCPKLAEDQIRKGYAHVLSIDDNPGKPELIEAQRDAIANRRGIWAHGVPDFVLTSLHSDEEDVENKGTYNRLVSTADGHSVKWKHDAHYAECDRVCQYEYSVAPEVVDAALIAARADADARTVIYDFARYRHINRKIAEDKRETCGELLTAMAEAGGFGQAQKREGACMIHVPFDRRFGGGRAECLK
jgi:hypothetical protein